MNQSHGPRLRAHTLGCKVNQYETEFVRQALVANGFRDAAEKEPADLCVVNTCTVTAEGDAKSRQLIRRLARENPFSRIIVMGCYATRSPGEVAALPRVSEVVRDKRDLPDLLRRLGIVDVPNGLSGFAGHRRAFVKVQDGCMLKCSFCVIPSVRPVLASRPSEHIIDEIGRLVAAGHREIVLTGIHLGHYGVEGNRGRPKSAWVRLSGLLARIVDLPGEFRVRLSSIEATEVTRDLIDVMANHPRRICPHWHISMQSGSDAVLRRMRRRWGAKRLVERCRLVQELLDQPALTTDVIVGFPGETEADFADTLRVCEEAGFSKIHAFAFSPREGTPAATMPDQVPPNVKRRRSLELARLEIDLRRRYFESLRGRRLSAIVEARVNPQNGQHWGTSCRFTPVEFAEKGLPVGEILDVEASLILDDELGVRIAGVPIPPMC